MKVFYERLILLVKNKLEKKEKNQLVDLSDLNDISEIFEKIEIEEDSKSFEDILSTLENNIDKIGKFKI